VDAPGLERAHLVEVGGALHASSASTRKPSCLRLPVDLLEAFPGGARLTRWVLGLAGWVDAGARGAVALGDVRLNIDCLGGTAITSACSGPDAPARPLRAVVVLVDPDSDAQASSSPARVSRRER